MNHLGRISAIVILIALAGCGPKGGRTVIDLQIEFLSRADCPNSPKMHANLDAAMNHAGMSTHYQTVDLGKLPASDPRRGYGTPTVLVNGADLFGMPVPSAIDVEPG